MSLEPVGAVGALEHGRELRVAHAGLLAGCAHRPRADADLDDVRAGKDQGLGHLAGDDVPGLEKNRGKVSSFHSSWDHMDPLPEKIELAAHLRKGSEDLPLLETS